MTDVVKIINDMEHGNTTTFGTIQGGLLSQVELDGEKFFMRPFSCYNWKIILDGEKVCLNPMCYDGDLKTIEFPLNIETMESCEFWLLYNFEKALIYEAITNEFLGEITEVLDARNIQERLADMRKAGEI